MNCDKCGNRTEVTDSRLMESNQVKRKRKCLNKECAHGFFTYEARHIFLNKKKTRRINFIISTLKSLIEE